MAAGYSPGVDRVATREDVARRAGVSTAVVSYVLNEGARPVAAATRARVLAAVEELGYRPNAIARALRSRRSRAFGLVVSDISNPFIGELARSIELEAFERGYTVLLGNTMVDPERQQRYLRHFLDRQVDGLALVPIGAVDADVVSELNGGRAPVVVLDRPAPKPSRSPALRAVTLLAENEEGGRLATEHLAGHGHRRIACLGGPPKLLPSTGRIAGWSAARAERGLGERASPLVRSSVSRAAGYEAGRELLGVRRPPSAVFATSDEQAIGLLRAAAELGMRVPDDVAVVGFDGIAEGRYCAPGLSTVRQPIEVIAARAVETLLAQVVGGVRRSRTERFPVELAARGSCGCPEVRATTGGNDVAPRAERWVVR